MSKRATVGVSLTVLCLLCMIGATACRSSSPGASQPGGPTLHVTLVKPGSGTILDTQVGDANAVRRLYDAALALPRVREGVLSCPAGRGTAYQLVFSGVQGTVGDMKVNADGCPFITFVQAHEAHMMDNSFIALFTKTIGVSSLDPAFP